MLRIDHPRDDRANRRGKTIIIDCGPDIYGWAGRYGLSDLLEVAGNYIDVAKVATLHAATMPETYLKDKVRQYHEAGVKTFAGGLLFEYAYLKNEVDGLIKLLKFLGIGGIEVSENYITLDDDERLRHIGTLIDAGLEVVFEYGRKYPDTPMDLTELEAVIDRVSAIGVHHVVLEQGEFDLLEAERPTDLEAMKSAPWLDSIFIEVEASGFPNNHAVMIERFGPDVNLANIEPGHVIKLEYLRRGCGRSIDYKFFRDLVATQQGSSGS